MRAEWLRWTKRLTAPLQLERQALRLPKATGMIGITVRTMIGVPAPTTGRTIGSTGIGGTAGTMDLIGERTMTGIAGRIITIIDDNDAHTVAIYGFRCIFLLLLNGRSFG
jgi:hypothetical protein